MKYDRQLERKRFSGSLFKEKNSLTCTDGRIVCPERNTFTHSKAQVMLPWELGFIFLSALLLLQTFEGFPNCTPLRPRPRPISLQHSHLMQYSIRVIKVFVGLVWRRLRLILNCDLGWWLGACLYVSKRLSKTLPINSIKCK